MPQPQLDRRAAVWPCIEILRDGLAVAALRRGCQPKQHAGANCFGKSIKPVSSQAVAFIHHHRMPMVGAHGGHKIAAGQAVDGGEQMVPAFGLVAPGEQLTEIGGAQHFTVGAQGLAQDFLAVGHKQKARVPAFAAAGVAVVERGHYRLAGAGGSHQQVAGATVGSFVGQLLQHLLLIGLGLEVKKADGGRGFATKRLAAQRGGQGLPVFNVVRVVALKFAVRP